MIRVTALSKTFADKERDVAAVDDVSFEVPEGKFYTLLGPSGCGKTTTLRCLAGLESSGFRRDRDCRSVVYSSRSRTFVRPDSRPIGMVFQSYAIWPHMNVFDNVAFPLVSASIAIPAPKSERKSPRCCRWSNSPGWTIEWRHSSPAASSNAWRSRVP